MNRYQAGPKNLFISPLISPSGTVNVSPVSTSKDLTMAGSTLRHPNRNKGNQSVIHKRPDPGMFNATIQPPKFNNIIGGCISPKVDRVDNLDIIS